MLNLRKIVDKNKKVCKMVRKRWIEMITFIKEKYRRLSPARKIALTFLLVILSGAVLLWLRQ